MGIIHPSSGLLGSLWFSRDDIGLIIGSMHMREDY